MSLPDAMSLRPAPDAGIWKHMPFKLALAQQHGIEEGFRRYHLACDLPATHTLRPRHIASLRDFALEHGRPFCEIAPGGEPVRVEPPVMLGPNDARELQTRSRSFFVTCLSDIVCDSYSSVLRAGDLALIDRESGERRLPDDFLELDPTVFAATAGRAWTIEIDEPVMEIEEAFGGLLGPQATHFGHWLHEYLPKYLLARRSGLLPAVPVLINPWGHVELRGALKRLLPDDVETIELTPYRRALVRRFWTAPALAYTPMLEKLDGWHGSLDYKCISSERFAPVLEWYRAKAEAIAGRPLQRSLLYVGRSPHLRRKLLNRELIEELARFRGFDVVYPETLPFDEQVRAIRHASHVLGPEGSAQYLSFFAQPRTKVAILSGPLTFDVTTYAYLLKDTGADVTVLTGALVNLNNGAGYPYFGNHTFSDFEIDESTFPAFLDAWLAPAA